MTCNKCQIPAAVPRLAHQPENPPQRGLTTIGASPTKNEP